MIVKDIIDTGFFKLVTDFTSTDKEIKGCYIGDLLSMVMSNAKKSDVWITVQSNINIVAVALLTEISCIILPEDIKCDENTKKKAALEDISILETSLTSFEIACLLKDKI